MTRRPKERDVKLLDLPPDTESNRLILRESTRNFEILLASLAKGTTVAEFQEDLKDKAHDLSDRIGKQCRTVIAVNDHAPCVAYEMNGKKIESCVVKPFDGIKDWLGYEPWNSPAKVTYCATMMDPGSDLGGASVSAALCAGVIDAVLVLTTPHAYWSGKFRSSLDQKTFRNLINLPAGRINWGRKVIGHPPDRATPIHDKKRYLDNLDWTVIDINEKEFENPYVLFCFLHLNSDLMRRTTNRAAVLRRLATRLFRAKFYRAGSRRNSVLIPADKTDANALIERGMEAYKNIKVKRRDPLRMEMFLTFSAEYEVVLKLEAPSFVAASNILRQMRCRGEIGKMYGKPIVEDFSSLVVLADPPGTAKRPDPTPGPKPDAKLLPMEVQAKAVCGKMNAPRRYLQVSTFAFLATHDGKWRHECFFRGKESKIRKKQLELIRGTNEALSALARQMRGSADTADDLKPDDKWESAVQKLGRRMLSFLFPETVPDADAMRARVETAYRMLHRAKLGEVLNSLPLWNALVHRNVTLHHQPGHFNVFMRFQTSLGLEYLKFVSDRLLRYRAGLIDEIQSAPHLPAEDPHGKGRSCGGCGRLSRETPIAPYRRPRQVSREDRKVLERELDPHDFHYPLRRTIDDSLHETVFELEQSMDYLIQLERSWYEMRLSLPAGDGNGIEAWSYLPKYEGSVSTFHKIYTELDRTRLRALKFRRRIRPTDAVAVYLPDCVHEETCAVGEALLAHLESRRADADVAAFFDRHDGRAMIKQILVHSASECLDSFVQWTDAWDTLALVFDSSPADIPPALRRWYRKFSPYWHVKKSLIRNVNDRTFDHIRGTFQDIRNRFRHAKDEIARVTAVYHDRVEGSQIKGTAAPKILCGDRSGVLDMVCGAIDALMQDYMGDAVHLQWRGITAGLSEKTSYHTVPSMGILNVPVDLRANLFAKLPPVAHEAAHVILYRIETFAKYKSLNWRRGGRLLTIEAKQLLQTIPTELPPMRQRKNQRYAFRSAAEQNAFRGAVDRSDKAFGELQNMIEAMLADAIKVVDRFHEALKRKREQALHDAGNSPEESTRLAEARFRAWHEEIKSRILVQGGEVTRDPSHFEILTDLIAGFIGGVPFFIALGIMEAVLRTAGPEPAPIHDHPASWLRLLLGRETALHFHWLEPEDVTRSGANKGGNDASDAWRLFGQRFTDLVTLTRSAQNLERFLIDRTANDAEYDELAELVVRKLVPQQGTTTAYWSDPGPGQAYDRELGLGGRILLSPWFFVTKAILDDKATHLDKLRDWMVTHFELKGRRRRPTLAGGQVLDSRLLFVPPPVGEPNAVQRRRIERASAAAVRTYVYRLAQRIGFDKALATDHPCKYIAAASIAWPNFRPVYPSSRLIHSLYYTNGDYNERNRLIAEEFGGGTRRANDRRGARRGVKRGNPPSSSSPNP